MVRSEETLMSALGLSRPAGRLYERLVPQSGQRLEELALGLEIPVPTLVERLQPLVAYGVVAVVDGRVEVTPPAEAVGRMLTETAAGAAAAHRRLQEIAAALPLLAGGGVLTPQPANELEPLDGELVLGNLGPEHFRAVIRQTAGDILLLRPDQWTLPYEGELADPIAEAVAAGRRCRAIYPVRVLSEAPAVVRHRTTIGEEIRLLPELPTRLVVLGSTHAVMPEPLGLAASPRIMVRQRGVVELAALYFECLWSRAEPLAEPVAGPDEQRRFLLEALASGAQDEQIARRLGLSLRTVRRRVAELMVDLGAHSRFQAGAEAVRRGWL